MELQFVDANLVAAVSSERGLHWMLVKESSPLTGAQGAFARTENDAALRSATSVAATAARRVDD